MIKNNYLRNIAISALAIAAPFLGGCDEKANGNLEKKVGESSAPTPAVRTIPAEEMPKPLTIKNSPQPEVRNASYHTVKSGDTLWHIARTHGLPVRDLIELNPNINPDVIHPGQKINLGDGSANRNNTGQDNYLSQMQVSRDGIELIKQYEGFEPDIYPDQGHPAIGYGHRLEEGESFTTINRETAERLLLKDLNEARTAVSRYVKVPLTQGQYNALCSFTFNLGEGNLENSTLLRKLNQGDYAGAADQFQRWVWLDRGSENERISQWLVQRRQAEYEMFNGGTK